MTRQAGAYGRRPPKRTPALKLGKLLTGVVPDHPVSVDYLAALGGGWEMLENDTIGDCVSVAIANMRRVVTATIGNGEVYPTLAQVEAFYKTQNPRFPAQDDGMDEQTALETLVKNGDQYFDGAKALAFASVDVTNPSELDAAIAIFGVLLFGITVTQANESEFSQGQPWDYVEGSPVAGGHGICGGGYTDVTSTRFITWAEETSFTNAFRERQVEEAWVVIWPEHLGSTAFLEGVSLAQLAADYQSLTGQPFPNPPTPEPTPTPAPTPTPTPPTSMEQADKALIKAFRAWEHTRTYHTEEHPMRHSVDI